MDDKGKFSIRSANGFSQPHRFTQECEALLGSLQNLKLHERLEMLLWKIANDILPTEARMKPTCKMETTCCPLCETEEETCLHQGAGHQGAVCSYGSKNYGSHLEFEKSSGVRE